MSNHEITIAVVPGDALPRTGTKHPYRTVHPASGTLHLVYITSIARLGWAPDGCLLVTVRGHVVELAPEAERERESA